MTAAEKAMQDIGAALDEFYAGSIHSVDALNRVARANGGYMMERTGVGA